MLGMAEKSIYIAEKSEIKRHEEPFKKIVEEHGRMLYAHIRSMVLNHDDTDDVLQNTFIKAWQNLDGFRNEASLSTWLFRIATNEALQHLRRQKLKNLFHISQQDMEPLQDGNDMHDGDAIRLKLEKAMHTLSVQQRTVFGMKYFNNMKYNDMSKVLNLKEGTLKAVYHNAVKKIEKYIIENA